jgi:hypothetical protein
MHGVVRTSRGVAMTSRGVAMTSRGLVMTSRGVAMTPYGVIMTSLGVVMSVTWCWEDDVWLFHFLTLLTVRLSSNTGQYGCSRGNGYAES